MALVPFLIGGAYIPVNPYQGLAIPSFIAQTMDAAGEAVHCWGKAYLPGGVGTSKTISSAGGKIYCLTGAVTFANGTTNLQVGIQDMSTSGQPARGDGSFDVSHTAVGGVDTINGTAFNTFVMSSGTKTIAHGDLIAVVFNMTARGGADSVLTRNLTTSQVVGRPGVTAEIAAAFTAAVAIPSVIIEFDDGTRGFINDGFVSSLPAIVTTHTYASNSTPDEYAMIFTVDQEFAIDELFAVMGESSAAGDFEMLLYRDALGTPAVERTITVDASQLNVLGVRMLAFMLDTPFTLLTGVTYAIAVRPTTTNTVLAVSFDVAVVADLDGHALGQDAYYGTRTNQTGAFSPTTTRRLMCGFRISSIHDGAGGAGGMIVHPGMSGRIAA